MKNISWIVFLAIGILGAVSAFIFYPKAFPQSALRVEITHDEAEELAAAYLARQGAEVAGWKRATVFEQDHEAQIFLQRAMGIPAFIAAVKADPELETWQYTTRFFRALEKEEYYVGTDARGDVVSFAHEIEESAPGATLDKAAARAVAEKFLQDHLGLALANYEEKGYTDEKLPGRTDHAFEFALKGSEVRWSRESGAGTGEKRLGIAMHGDTVGAFEKYIFVPEDFRRRQETADATGMLLTVLAVVLEVALTAAAIFFLFRRYKTGDLRPRRVLVLVSAAAAVLLASVAATPSGLLFAYNTTTPWPSFLTLSVVIALVSIGVFIISSLMMGIPGESLAREYFPAADDADPLRTLPRRLLASRIAKGFLFGIGMMGYVSAFYYVGGRFFGIWSPLTPEISGYMASTAPFITPLAVGLTAAVSEEFAFRLFAIPFLKKYARYTILAVLVPAVIWAFLHSMYPVYPMYARGIELTVVGLALGYVFIKEGLLTALVAHFSFNAVLLSLPLLASGNAWLQFSGVASLALTMLLPCIYLLCTEEKLRTNAA